MIHLQFTHKMKYFDSFYKIRVKVYATVMLKISLISKMNHRQNFASKDIFRVPFLSLNVIHHIELLLRSKLTQEETV